MKKILLCLVCSVFMSTAVHAACVDTFGIGPKATSLGGAVVAQSNDVYSIYYNPAALSELKGAQLSAAIQMCDPDLKFHEFTIAGGDGSQDYDSGYDIPEESDNLYIPFLGYAQPINDKISVGVAAYVPYGLDIEWDKTKISALNWYHSYYIRETVTPTISYKFSDKLSFGFGVALGMSESGAEKVLNNAAPSEYSSLYTGLDPTSAADITNNISTVTTRATNYFTAQGYSGDQLTAAVNSAVTSYQASATAYLYDGQTLELELEDDFNYSFNFGVLYKPAENVALGLTYRGKTDATFEGDVKIGGTTYTTAEMDYDHPEQLQAGVMVRPVPSVTLELDVVWTNWSINSNQTAYFNEALFGAKYYDCYARDWNDTNQIRFGAEWQVNDLLALRCGYFYDPTPIPDDTFDIMWPDADRKTYSIGAGFNFGSWTLDASIQLAHAETKRIIGGESDNLNDSYNPTGTEGYYVVTSADGYLLGYGLALTYNF